MSAPRFTADELLAIVTATHMRAALVRDSGSDYDRIDVPNPPGLTGTVYRFQRDATGTALLYIGADEWRLLASGTLAECLRAFDADPRFSLEELATLSRFAGRRIDAGDWSEIERQGTPRHDRIVIHVPADDGRYTLERDATGATRLLQHRADGVHEQVRGTLDECLRYFIPPTKGGAE
jgi:hypothetical protein